MSKNEVKCTKSARGPDAHQNFQIFLVALNFIHTEELILIIATHCENFTFFKARLLNTQSED